MVKIIKSKKQLWKIIDKGYVYESRPHIFRYINTNKLAFKFLKGGKLI